MGWKRASSDYDLDKYTYFGMNKSIWGLPNHHYLDHLITFVKNSSYGDN